MSTKTVTVSGTGWTALTTSGQSGACWLNSNMVGYGNVAVDHSVTGISGCGIAKSLILYRDYGAILTFTADSISDVFYARCIDPVGTVALTVDAN